ncbi:MAG: HAMP domain-containing histidine kinase [Gammaproteobacteria bacterium]|nr:HAMP domain-containing histidine kinase [Gammaproteobacteria bacterium]
MENNRPRVFDELERLAILVPAAFYWTDTNAIIKGFNLYCPTIIGSPSSQGYLDKGPYDMYTPETAKVIYENTIKVVQTGKTLTFEESIADLSTGKIRYYNVIRSPLFEDGKVVGTVGVTIETTSEKEMEHLKLETEQQKVQLGEAEKVSEIAEQVVHDISAPLTSLKVLITNLVNVNEDTRVALRNATSRISDIVNTLAIKYQTPTELSSINTRTIEPTIISCLVESILAEKRAQYGDYNINFELHIADNTQDLFAKVNFERFKRAVSNIIDNAIEGIVKAKQDPGCINVFVNKEGNFICILIKDSSCNCDYPQPTSKKLGVDQIPAKIAGDHGIELFAAISQINEWGGEYVVDSKPGVGTTFTIKLPITETPIWFQGNLDLVPNSLVIILDDDPSIHTVWESKFKEYQDKISLRHFSTPESLFEQLKELQINPNILYLIDYELLGSKDNGLDVIKKLQAVKNAFLVTSHYEDQKIRKKCADLNVKIIPKKFAPYILIQVKKS